MRERFPFEVFARIIETKDDLDRILQQYSIIIKTRDGKQREFRSTPGLRELDVVNFLRQVDKLTLRLTAQNFVRLRKNFFLAAAEGYGIIEDNMCDCTAEMVVRQFMGSLEELIDFEYQNFSGQNKWSIPITATVPANQHVVVKFTTPREILETTSVPTHDHLYSYDKKGNRLDAQTRGLRALQQRYIFGGPLDNVDCYPKSETTRKDRMEKLTNFTFIIPVTEKLFREIRIHNTRVFPRNEPIEVYRAFVEEEINKRILIKPEIKMQWNAIKINLRDEIVLALYSMFKLGTPSAVYFEEKNFFSSPEWATPKELHHFAKYFMSVLQLPDSEADKSYSLMTAPYPTGGETLYRTEVLSEPEIAEDDARLRCCPNMTTREIEQANQQVPSRERPILHNDDVMTQRQFLDEQSQQRVRDSFEPVQTPQTCADNWRQAMHQGRTRRYGNHEQEFYDLSGASTSSAPREERFFSDVCCSHRPRTDNVSLAEALAPARINVVVAPPVQNQIVPAPQAQSAQLVDATPAPVVSPPRNSRQQADADGWVLVNRGNRSLPVVNQAEAQSTDSSSESFDIVTSSDSENSAESDVEEPEQQEAAPRPQAEIDAEERRRVNKRRRQRNRRDRRRQGVEERVQRGNRRHHGERANHRNRPRHQNVVPAVQADDPHMNRVVALARRLEMLPVRGGAVPPNLDYDTEEENYVPPPMNDANVPRCLDFTRITLYHNMREYLEKKVNQFDYHPDKKQQFLDRYVQFNNVYRTQYEICTLFAHLKYQTKSVRNLLEKFFVHKSRSLVSPQYANSEFLEEMQANSWAAEECSRLLTEIDLVNLNIETLRDGLGFIDMKCDVLRQDHPFLAGYRVICDRLIMQGYEQRVFYRVITSFFEE